MPELSWRVLKSQFTAANDSLFLLHRLGANRSFDSMLDVSCV